MILKTTSVEQCRAACLRPITAAACLVLVAFSLILQPEPVRAADPERPVADTVAQAGPEGATEPAQAPARQAEEVIVTGSRIKGASDTGAIAVTVHSSEDLEGFGTVDAGRLLSNIAQAGSIDFNETSDGPNSARGDVASVNLRGLGAGNTLVLLNGRRLVPHPVSQDIGQTPRQVVNVNSLPLAALDRVEVLRDGASALYGADATAGVVNTILRTDYEGFRAEFRHGGSLNTDLSQDVPTIVGGIPFNEGKSNLIFSLNNYKRDGLYAAEREYSRSVDTRRFLPDDWAGDSEFRNTSTRSPWGEFEAFEGDAQDVLIDLVRVRSFTNRGGRFHVQPCDFPGTRAELSEEGPEGCAGLDDGSLNTSLRFDFNSFQTEDASGNGRTLNLQGADELGRQITPMVERNNLFTTLTHDFDNGIQFFSDVFYYRSASRSQRAAQPIDDGLFRIAVPRGNYWNPFGPVAFADGTSNPNRLDGLPASVPDEGLQVLIRRWRPIEHGPRIIEVKSDTYRLLGGVRGDFRGWDWETALLYNLAETKDTARNRISKTAMSEQLALQTEEALNPFGGPYANPTEVMDRIRSVTVNQSETSLASWDFRISRPDMFELPAGGLGTALGLEVRREDYEDDRDPRLDGTIVFRDGQGTDGSDVVGVSPTNDSSANRFVYSSFVEVLTPLVSEAMNIPLVESIDLQLAARIESFSDTDENILKPKVSLSWSPVSWWIFRTGYSEGFRAPNLIQLHRGAISRLNRGQRDFYRADVTDSEEDTGDTYRRSIRQSNPDLKSEETETIVVGTVMRLPFFRNVTFSADYWNFKQENVIDNFGAEQQLALDFLLRRQGSLNPSVVRADVISTEDQMAFDAWNADPNNENDQRQAVGEVLFVQDPYLNLDPRDVQGIDLGLAGVFNDTALGIFRFSFEGSYLLKFDQRRDQLLPLLNDPLFADEADIQALRPDRIKIEGHPRWRVAGSASWRYRKVGAGLSLKYTSSFYDTSASNNDTGDFWEVDDWLVFNGYIDYRFRLVGERQTRARFGMNNIMDEEPPLADQNIGYYSSFHSNRGRFGYIELRTSFY